jgi:hypothetical protein
VSRVNIQQVTRYGAKSGQFKTRHVRHYDALFNKCEIHISVQYSTRAQHTKMEEHQSRSILKAAWACDLHTLQMLLSEGVKFDINYRGKSNYEHEQDGETYDELLENVLYGETGVIIDGYTPLQAAVCRNSTACAKILIENNADVNSITPTGFLTKSGQSALGIAMSRNMRDEYEFDAPIHLVRMLLAAGAVAPDILRHINNLACLPYGREYNNLAVLELVFASMTDSIVEDIIPTHVPEKPWSDEALKLLKFHQGRGGRRAALEENNMTFALSLHPRAVRHGAIPSQLSKEIAWKIMEYVCAERPATGRR